jgi:hypothetical protein
MRKKSLLVLLVSLVIIFAFQVHETSLVNAYSTPNPNANINANNVNTNNGNNGGNANNLNDEINNNQGFNYECSNFFNDANYYSIVKWKYDVSSGDYVVEEENHIYRFYITNVFGDLNEANWTSSIDTGSVLVKAGSDTFSFEGGRSGMVNSTKDISHVTLCGYRTGNGGNGNGNGVPEFSSLGLIAAVLSVTLGMVFLRKN